MIGSSGFIASHIPERAKSLKGAFTNRNHFAQFLALSIGPLVWWMLSQRTDTNSGLRQLKGLGPARANHSRFDNIVDMKMLLMICAVGGVIVSIMLSLSRGGMVAAALASTVCLAGLWKSGRVGASLAVVIVGVGGIVDRRNHGPGPGEN